MYNLRLNLGSNAKYQLSITSKNGYCQKFLLDENQQTLTLRLCLPIITIKASPVLPEFSNAFYYSLDARCFPQVNLYFKFANRQAVTALNTFYLTDKTYGLKIDGRLYFQKI